MKNQRIHTFTDQQIRSQVQSKLVYILLIRFIKADRFINAELNFSTNVQAQLAICAEEFIRDVNRFPREAFFYNQYNQRFLRFIIENQLVYISEYDLPDLVSLAPTTANLMLHYFYMDYFLKGEISEFDRAIAFYKLKEKLKEDLLAELDEME